MTESLKQLFEGFDLRTCYGNDLRYDVLVKNYDGKSRDLLIEAKPDPDKGGIRIAIGQLLDYRRFFTTPRCHGFRCLDDLVAHRLTHPTAGRVADLGALVHRRNLPNVSGQRASLAGDSKTYDPASECEEVGALAGLEACTRKS
jgi:hypothetical protein